jgi:hypothetical protein
MSVARHRGQPHQLGEGTIVAPVGDPSAESLACSKERVGERTAPQHVVLGVKLAHPNLKVTSPPRSAGAVRGSLSREGGADYCDEYGRRHPGDPWVETSQSDEF